MPFIMSPGNIMLLHGAVVVLMCSMFSVSKLVQAGYISDNIYILPFNNTENLTDIQHNACHLPVSYSLHILDVPMTWMDGMQVCYDMGYQTIMNAMSHWLTRKQIKRYLEVNNYTDTYAFWTGIFRPYVHVKQWYCNWGWCRTFNGLVLPSGNSTDGLCSVIRRNNSSDTEWGEKEDCTNLHPFVCYKSINQLQYMEYENLHVNSMLLDAAYFFFSEDIGIGITANISDGFNSTTNVTDNNSTTDILQQCFHYCSHTDHGCNGFTYDTRNISSPSCIFIINSELSYSLSELSNVTHYAKYDCNITMNNTYIVPTLNRTFASFSYDCDVDEVPASYATCSSGCLGDLMLEELIANLTLDKKSTLKYQSQFKCIEDNRPSAISIGTLGIVIMVLFVSVFPLCDKLIPKIPKNKKVRPKPRKKSKSE